MSSRRVALITGASAGVGRATVREFAARSYDVGLLAPGPAGLEAAARDVSEAGGRALILQADVSQFDQVGSSVTARTFDTALARDVIAKRRRFTLSPR